MPTENHIWKNENYPQNPESTYTQIKNQKIKDLFLDLGEFSGRHAIHLFLRESD